MQVEDMLYTIQSAVYFINGLFDAAIIGIDFHYPHFIDLHAFLFFADVDWFW